MGTMADHGDNDRLGRRRQTRERGVMADPGMMADQDVNDRPGKDR